MKRPLLALLLIWLLLPLSVFADETTKIGEATIKLPLPAGFVRLDGVNAGVDKLMASVVPPTNRLLMVLAPPADVALAKAGTPGNLKRYMLLETFVGGENEHLTLKDFAEVLSGVESQFAANGKSAADLEADVNKLLKDSSVAAELKMGETKFLGVYDKSDRSIEMGMISKVQINQEAPMAQVAAASIMMVQGKVSYLYVYSNFTGPDDAAWTKDTVKAWRAAILAANP